MNARAFNGQIGPFGLPTFKYKLFKKWKQTNKQKPNRDDLMFVGSVRRERAAGQSLTNVRVGRKQNMTNRG